jgi:hypothetical protein
MMKYPVQQQPAEENTPKNAAQIRAAAIKRRMQKMKKNEPSDEKTQASSFGGLK